MKKLLMVVMVLLILTVLLTAALPVSAKNGGGSGQPVNPGEPGWNQQLDPPGWSGGTSPGQVGPGGG
jgi:hypothetical protein